jgi:DNA-directed RNA polymerase specialized sigma24 family protein
MDLYMPGLLPHLPAGQPPSGTKMYSVHIDAEGYGSWLHRIAWGLGLGDKESKELVEQACRQVWEKRSPASVTDVRTELAMVLVRRAVFSISSRLFSQKKGVPDLPANSWVSSRLCHLPLSFRVVYLLSEVAGLHEKQIALILNVSTVLVRERQVRALQLLQA